MLDVVVAAGLENVEESVEIGPDVVARVGERMADARLRREMDHALGLMFGEQRGDGRLIGDIGLDEREAVAGRKQREPCPLEVRRRNRG